MTLQNRKVADEKWKHFSITLIFKIKLQLIVYLNIFPQPDGLLHDDWRAV